MDNYEQKCLKLDKELAELLGWHRLFQHELPPHALMGDNPFQNKVNTYISRWSQNDAAAFRLAVEHEINWHLSRDYDEIVTNYGAKFDTQYFPSDLAAVRYAIVQAVINKLKAANG